MEDSIGIKSVKQIPRFDISDICTVCMMVFLNFTENPISYDVMSGNEITPCTKIDKPLVIYGFTGNIMMSITKFCT